MHAVLPEDRNKKSYKFLTYIVSLYSFFFLLPSILLRKMVDIPFVGVIPISILFTGIYFMLLDIITEVYGYKEGRKTLLAGLLAYTAFVFILKTVSYIDSPENYRIAWGNVQDSNAYIYLFGNLHFVWISVVICALFANTLNMIVLSKWKILVKGKYFWMRSLGTSFVAAFIYSLVSNFFAFGLFLGKAQVFYFLKLLLISLSAKLITLFLFAYPATIFCYFLKRAEGVDVYDYGLNFNPFQKISTARGLS